jgi:hypothetical protein
MRTKRAWIPAVFAAATLVGAWLFLGVFEDREFKDPYLFVKHRPTAKVFFHAPMGESDTPTFDQLSPAQQYEERAFREFVELGGGYRRSLGMPICSFGS